MKPNRRRKAAPGSTGKTVKAPTRARKKFGPETNTRWHAAFLKTLAADGRICEGLRVVGVTSKTLQEHRSKFPEFNEAMKDVQEVWYDNAEREVYARGVEGWNEPVYQGGKKVGNKKMKSDACLLFLLKGRRRDVYGDKLAVNQSTSITLTPDKALEIAAQRQESIIATMKAAAGLMPANLQRN